MVPPMHRQSYEQKRKAGNILSSKSLAYKQLQVNTNAAQVFVQIPQMIWHKKRGMISQMAQDAGSVSAQ